MTHNKYKTNHIGVGFSTIRDPNFVTFIKDFPVYKYQDDNNLYNLNLGFYTHLSIGNWFKTGVGFFFDTNYGNNGFCFSIGWTPNKNEYTLEWDPEWNSISYSLFYNFKLGTSNYISFGIGGVPLNISTEYYPILSFSRRFKFI